MSWSNDNEICSCICFINMTGKPLGHQNNGENKQTALINSLYTLYCDHWLDTIVTKCKKKNQMKNNFSNLGYYDHWKYNVLAMRKKSFDMKLIIMESG